MSGGVRESEEHTALAELLRLHPELAVDLVRRISGAELPAGCTVCSGDPVLRPMTIAADALTQVIRADGAPELGIWNEIQRSPDERKKLTWPVYEWGGRARDGCDSCVLVIATTRAVAAWARRPIVNRFNSASQVVAGPDEVPRISDFAEARANPALAVLSAALHKNGPDGIAVVRAAAAALRGLPNGRAWPYSSLVFNGLKQGQFPAIRKDIMQELESEQPWLVPNWREEPLSAGWERFLDTYRQDGLIEARVAILLRQLERRGFAVDEATRARVNECQDIAQLDEWLDRVLVASGIDEVFA